MTTEAEKIPDIHWDEDADALRDLVRESLRDPRIANYVSRGHVSSKQVINIINRSNLYLKCRETEAFQDYAKIRLEVDKLDRRIAEANSAGAINWKTFLVGLAMVPTVLIIISEFADKADPFLKTLLILFSVITATSAGAFLGYHLQRRGKTVLRSLITAFTLLIFAVCSIALPVEFAIFPWSPVGAYVNIGVVFAAGALLSHPKTARDSGDLVVALGHAILCLLDSPMRAKKKKAWLDYSLRELIYPNVVRTINRVLGADSTKLLVEQDSEGLRRLQDPKLTVPTMSESRLRNLLDQMDGGSIAVTGPRGAGKSTLLRRISTPEADLRSRQLSLYISAPAEYVAREFLAELFQQVCDTYLQLHDTPVAGMRYRGLRTHRDTMRAARGAIVVLRLTLRALFALTLLAVAFVPLIAGVHPATAITHMPVGHWRGELTRYATAVWSKHQEIIQIAAGFLAILWWPRKTMRRRRLSVLRRSTLVRRARDYSIHLKIERTTSRTANLGMPAVRGTSISLSKQTSEKYVPWSMPELVGKLREFIADISKTADGLASPVVIGIDEIDRIGSVEQAERFIGEIKAVFGIPNCFFLVSVAEDVGFLFSRRSIVGQSTLEHSFDDVVVVDALELDEASGLLSARVPGFTDSFVFLALALSGGLPREMIRVARRLVEVNLQEAGHHPMIGDLALHLVAENVREVLRTSRNQLARLSLSDPWGNIFHELRDAMVLLQSDKVSRGERLKIIHGLCSLRPPDPTKQKSSNQDTDSEAAAKIMSGLAAFACYSYTVIEAFDNDYFDLSAARASTYDTGGGSYAELAAARLELGISPESSQSIIHRFRARSGLTPLPEVDPT